MNGSVENYIQKVNLQHGANHRLLETGNRTFAIQHFAGKVNYDATDFTGEGRGLLVPIE
jgi:myosin heavy subunit